MRIAFFGLPLAAIFLHRDGHDIVWAGICRRGSLGTRRLTQLVGPQRVHLVPDLSVADECAALELTSPELLVSWFWTKRLPPRVLGIAPGFGVHPSLLPRHRGPDPYFWAIDHGDDVTGVSAHTLGPEYDTGDVLGRRVAPIDPHWNAWQLARALDRPSLQLLREIVGAFANGHSPVPKVQDEALATQAMEPSDDDLAVRWTWPSERIERRIRAAAPWPGAWTEIGGRFVTIVRATPTSNYPRTLAPGEAAVRPDGITVVRTGTDALELEMGRDEDDVELGRADFARIVRVARSGECSE